MLSRGERPLIRSAKVYVLYGTLSVENVEAVKRYVINRVESREASLELPETLTVRHEQPDTVETETGFIALEEAGLFRAAGAAGTCHGFGGPEAAAKLLPG